MNTINKIGVMALTKIFGKKPFVSNEKNYISELIFSKQEISPASFSKDYDKSYMIWSIELGIINVPLKINQNVYRAVIKVLKKLQKDSVPSHLIVSEIKLESIKVTTTYTIYRFTEEQELTMYFQDLMPSINKREKELQVKAKKDQEQYLAWCKEFEDSLKV